MYPTMTYAAVVVVVANKRSLVVHALYVVNVLFQLGLYDNDAAEPADRAAAEQHDDTDNAKRMELDENVIAVALYTILIKISILDRKN